uniref:Upstream open reading frame n=1 Tax=Mus musculus TaxID=10090 RepID=Q8CFB9_MOUSE|nr:upstream open reading frame [Mus musculus]
MYVHGKLGTGLKLGEGGVYGIDLRNRSC